MEAIVFVSVVLTAVVVATIRVQATPIRTDRLTPQEDDRRQTALENPDADSQGNVLKFLAVLDEAQKSAHARAGAKGTSLRENAAVKKLLALSTVLLEPEIPVISKRIPADEPVQEVIISAEPEGGSSSDGNAKYGKKGKMEDLSEDQPLPLLHHDVVAELSEGLSELNPLSGKHFRKASQQSSKKSKKRACFWKYCIQNK